MSMSKEQKIKELEKLKAQRPQLIKELRASHDRFLKGENNLGSILGALIFLLEIDQQIAGWDAVK
jgi:hypothetical protein